MENRSRNAAMSPTTFHKMPPDSKLCEICGCTGLRTGVWHKALTADEAFEWRATYVKRVKVSFGSDTTIEAVRQ